MATNEELETRIAELEGMVVAQYDPPSGPEYSFPVPGQPMDQDQFQLLAMTDGNGIIDRNGSPYTLKGWPTTAETNQKNSMILTVSGVTGKAESKVSGFYHVMTEDKVIPLDPVTDTTTYRICITYDPRMRDDSSGPVTVEVYTTEPPITFGRVPTEIYTVTRKPNQLLSDAEIKRSRPRISPTITVAQPEQMPDVRTVLWASVCFVHRTNEIYMAVGETDESEGPTRWKNLTGPLQTYTRPDGVYKWAGHGAKPGGCRIGQVVYLEGRLSRGDRFEGKDYNAGATYILMTLPEDMRPIAERRFIVKCDSWSNTSKSATVYISADGTVNAVPNVDCTWIGLDGITFTLTR